jgi:hypothetical protein
MTHKDGILSALDTSMPLEDKIRTSLYEVVSDHSRRYRYPDRQDKQNVLRRELILATLATILEYQDVKSIRDHGNTIVELNNEIDPFTELFAAFRDMLHDAQRLNEGMTGELITAPALFETIDSKKVISERRKLRLMWYAAAELHTKNDQRHFASKAELERYAAGILDSSQKSLCVERSKLKKCGAEEEQALFYSFINTSRELAKSTKGTMTALELFLPAVLALFESKISSLSRKVN